MAWQGAKPATTKAKAKTMANTKTRAKAQPNARAKAQPKAAAKAPVLTLTKKGAAANPRNGQQSNATTWAGIQAYLKANNNVTQAALTQHCTAQFNHGSFVAYAIKNNWLALSS